MSEGGDEGWRHKAREQAKEKFGSSGKWSNDGGTEGLRGEAGQEKGSGLNEIKGPSLALLGILWPSPARRREDGGADRKRGGRGVTRSTLRTTALQ